MAEAPRSVNVENMITGSRGKSTRRCLSVSSPSMTGISMSRVTRSGLSWAIFASAIRPLAAVPTTSMSGSSANESATSLRTTTESSTTSTRICATGPHLVPERKIFVRGV